MKKLIFATGNKGKLAEVREILGSAYEIVCPADMGIFDEPEETGETFQENSLLKAQALYEKTGLDCFADDTGLCVDALDGAPGVYSARYAGEQCSFDDNIAKLLGAMEGIENRKAHFECVATLLINGEPHYFSGRVDGQIAVQRSGKGGFGYDPIFLPDAFPGKSFADLSDHEKNAVSHRGESIRKMAAWMKENL